MRLRVLADDRKGVGPQLAQLPARHEGALAHASVNPSRYPNLRMLAPSPLLLCALYGIHGPITFAYYVPAVRHVKELTREHVSGLLRGLQSGLLAQSLRKLHRRVEEARDTFRSEKECRA